MTQELPREGKAAVVQALSELTFTDEQVIEVLGIPQRTLSRYKKLSLQEEWQEFGKRVKAAIANNTDFELSQTVAEKLMEKMEKDDVRFYDLVGLYKISRELQQQRAQTPAVQVNFQQNIAAQREKYDL